MCRTMSEKAASSAAASAAPSTQCVTSRPREPQMRRATTRLSPVSTLTATPLPTRSWMAAPADSFSGSRNARKPYSSSQCDMAIP